MKNYGFNGSQVRQILDSETGSIQTSSQGFDVLKDRDQLLVEPVLQPMKPLKMPEEGTYWLPKEAVKGAESPKVKLWRCHSFISKTPDVATLDARKVSFPLTIRRVETGDWMQPYGMKGRKLLSDLMTDRKMTLFDKRRQLVVVDAHGVILWAVGLRVDHRFRVCNDTQEVLAIQICT